MLWPPDPHRNLKLWQEDRFFKSGGPAPKIDWLWQMPRTEDQKPLLPGRRGRKLLITRQLYGGQMFEFGN
jgi:hypothetical protein